MRPERLRTAPPGAAAALRLRGFSASNLKTKWYAFQKRGWRALINEAKLKKGGSLPVEFCEYWRELVAGNDRPLTVATAYKRFMMEFRQGKRIDGIGTWQDWHAKHVRHAVPAACPWDVITQPPLLSAKTCSRIPLSTAETVAQRKGVGAARKHLATLRTDLSGMRLLEGVVFDDFETDFYVMDFDSGQVCVLVGLAAMDMATRKILAFTVRPRLTRDDGTSVGVARRDMLHLCGRLLKQYGWNRDYVSHWIMENAAATVSEECAELLHLITGGQVVVKKTTMFKGKAVLGGWSDTAGNPNGKLIETFWNLAWNHLGWELGQKGANYTLKSGTVDARKAEAARLIRAGEGLSLELKRELLDGYFNSVEEAREIIGSTWENLADRIGHKMEGFAEVREWRWRGQAEWRNAEVDTSFMSVPRDALKAAVETRKRLETSNERARRLLARDGANFEKASDSALALLFVDSITKTYDGSGVFLVEKKNRAPRMFAADGLGLIEGRKYTLVHDGDDFQEAFVLDQQGCFLGVSRHVQRVSYLHDPEGLARAIEAKERRVKETLARVKGRQKGDDVAARMLVLDRQETILNSMPGMELNPVERVAPGAAELISRREGKKALAKMDHKAAMRALLASGLPKDDAGALHDLDF